MRNEVAALLVVVPALLIITASLLAKAFADEAQATSFITPQEVAGHIAFDSASAAGD